MSNGRSSPPVRRWPETARWGVGFALALGLHATAAAALLARWNDDDDLVANAPVITVDLAPMAAAPQTTPTEAPPDRVERKQQTDPDPRPETPVEETEVAPEPASEKPPEKVEVKPDNAPQSALAAMPPPKPAETPKEKKTRPRHKTASLARAASRAERRADRAAAPAAGANSHNPSAVPNWKSQLVSQLERYKRYPAEAQSRGEHGVAQLAFSIDRGGGVHNARIVRSSGSSLLDAATLSLVARAAPLPPPPPELQGARIPIVVPIRYTMR